MTKKQAEDFIYKSYLKAQKYQNYNAKDSKKRRNDLTFDLIRKKSGTSCVVVTGSKGKGSVANMLSQILQTKYKIGLMTSPHIVDFCERFQVNSRKISNEDFIKQISIIQNEIEAIDEALPKNVCISPMGIQTYLALNYFKSCNTEFNVFECGKGAKFDDVNNVLHDYAVINNIFLEHTREPGKTLEDIAKDKSHVITGEQKCVYTAEQTPEVLTIIQNRAHNLNVPLKIYGKDFYANNIQYTKDGMLFDIIINGQTYPDILIPLLGEHQAKNCALAFALCKDIIGKFDLVKVRENLSYINWPGRIEIISKKPFILLDACINQSACENVINVLNYLNIDKVIKMIDVISEINLEDQIENIKNNKKPKYN